MGGVAYLSLEDNEVSQDDGILTLFSYVPFSGAVCGRHQVSRHASYETLPGYGTAVWWRKDCGGTSSAIRNSQVQNLVSTGVLVTNICPALRSYQPSPFFVLDEVDAALDNTNVAKVANYIRAHASETFQFIIISLKGSLYERGNSLVGIYRDQDMNSSRTLTLDVRVCFFSEHFKRTHDNNRRQLTQYDE